MSKSAISSIAALAAVSVLTLSFPMAASAQGRAPGGPGGPGASPPHQSRAVERFMLLYDINGDGKVTAAEINEDQSRIFTAMDVDNDSSLSTDEMKRRGRLLQAYRTTTLFDLMDANGDGKLSLKEVQAPTRRWFKRYDVNNDGAMEASEVPVRHGRRGRGRGRR